MRFETRKIRHNETISLARGERLVIKDGDGRIAEIWDILGPVPHGEGKRQDGTPTAKRFVNVREYR